MISRAIQISYILFSLSINQPVIKSIIVFSSSSSFNFIKTSQTKPSIFTLNSSVIRITHSFHNFFLSASFKGWNIIVHSITKLSLVLSSSSQQFFFCLSSVMLCCLFTEEIITMENPISIHGSSSHPKWSDSSQPPLVCFHNEVGIVKHCRLYLTN